MHTSAHEEAASMLGAAIDQVTPPHPEWKRQVAAHIHNANLYARAAVKSKAWVHAVLKREHDELSDELIDLAETSLAESESDHLLAVAELTDALKELAYAYYMDSPEIMAELPEVKL